MRRPTMLGALVTVGLLFIRLAAYQQPASQLVVGLEEVRPNLYMATGGGGNSAVFVGSDGVTVVDTKNPGWGSPLLEQIRSVTNRPVVRIINTHTHGDHVSGNVEFPVAVEVVAHENTAANMQEMRPRTGRTAEPGPNIFQRNDGKGLPERTFTDTMTIGNGTDQIDLHYFGRAHTNGDAFVVFPALRAMHSGDAFHARDLPIMDSNNGGSGVEFSATLNRAAAALADDVDVIINGHNSTTTTIADMKIQAQFIAEFVQFVQDTKRSGRTMEDVVATWSTPAKYVGYAPANPERVAEDAQVIWQETLPVAR